MEDVLEVYQRPDDPKRPQVCLDEASKQLVAQTRTPVPAAPGRPARQDYEYERKGTANVFMACEPLAGERRVRVTERRTAVDFAETIRLLVDEWYPDAEEVVLVMDNLNTHTAASLYEAFPLEEARRLLGRLEIHHTPKHGSWLHMAEIELSVLGRQCQNRRTPSPAELTRAAAARERDVDALCEHPRRKRRRPLIEVYPSGITRPGFGATNKQPVSPSSSPDPRNPPKK
jgi:hypothetical protein